MGIVQMSAIITLIKGGQTFNVSSYHIPPIGSRVNMVTKGRGCVLSGYVASLEYDYEWSVEREQTYVRIVLE